MFQALLASRNLSSAALNASGVSQNIPCPTSGRTVSVAPGIALAISME